MKRRICSLLAAVCLILAVTPAVRGDAESWIQYPVTGGNIFFDKSSGAVTNCESLVTKADIPNVIETVRVTSIGDGAFFNRKSLTSVNIPDSVTSIGNYAFLGCTSLTSINIPDGVTFIGDSAFRGCKMTSVSIPGNVTSIGEWTFLYCTGLTGVTIANSVISIGKGAFWGCARLTSISIPDSVISIGESAFAECTGLTDVSIPDSVTSIGDGAFYNCTGLTSVSIPDSVTSIGDAAFFGCTGLADVYYDGTKAEYETKLLPNVINSGNNRFLNATFHFKDDPSSNPNPTLPNTAASDHTALHGTLFLLLTALTLTLWALRKRKKDK